LKEAELPVKFFNGLTSEVVSKVQLCPEVRKYSILPCPGWEEWLV